MGRSPELSVQDAFWLEMDRPNNLMVIDSLLWTSGPIDWDGYRTVIRERLWDRYPAFRSVPERDRNGGWRWIEQPATEFDEHLRRVVLPGAGDDAALRELIAFERTVPLGRDRPLWRHLLVENYRGGSAVFMRAHHAIADGIRMVQLALSIGDASPEGGEPAPPRLQPRHDPAGSGPGRGLPHVGTWALARAAIRNPVGGVRAGERVVTAAVGSAASLADALVRHTGRIGRGVSTALAATPGDTDIVRKLLLGTRNDATCWTGRVGPRKAVSWSAPIPLDTVKQVARARDATVNDVLVTCVAASLRAYLQDHDASCSSVNWDVPVNLQPFDPTLPEALGNKFAIVQLELPTDIADPVAELDVVKSRMARIKRGHEAQVAYVVQAMLSKLDRRLYRLLVDLLADRAIGVLTNVPGPQEPIYLTGQKVEGAMGWAPLSGDQAMSVTVFSYDAKVFVGIACDVGLVPDHQRIVDGFGEAFGRLAAAV